MLSPGAGEDDSRVVLSELEVCRHRIQQLEDERERLECKLAFYEMHKDAVGLVPEAFVVGLVKGREAGNGRCDIVARNGIHLEVKFSRPRRIKKGIFRWEWFNVTGRDGYKRYGRLILIGDADTPHRSGYAYPTSRYVIFDVPYHVVEALTISNGPRKRTITLNTNREAARSASSVLFDDKYQASEAELANRYGR